MLYASKMTTLAIVVNVYTVNKPVLALMHVWPCHVSKSEARKLREC